MIITASLVLSHHLVSVGGPPGGLDTELVHTAGNGQLPISGQFSCPPPRQPRVLLL